MAHGRKGGNQEGRRENRRDNLPVTRCCPHGGAVVASFAVVVAARRRKKLETFFVKGIFSAAIVMISVDNENL